MVRDLTTGNECAMFVITGAAGFIGSCLIRRLNDAGETDLVLVDDFSDHAKKANLAGKKFTRQISIETFPAWFEKNASAVSGVFHFGACSNTAEFDERVFDRLNRNYSKVVWKVCTEHKIPLVYASSAATYGAGESGYSDNHAHVSKLRPLNPYGQSKHDFDMWALGEKKTPPRWYGLKFFNVYGPNEAHKARMASMVFHGFNQVQNNGFVNLFKSHRPDFKDGGQSRDFMYVKDAVEVSVFFMKNPQTPSGLYNVGTGTARSFLDMQKAIFAALQETPDIRFIDIPEDIRDKYQYFTEAPLEKLRAANYTRKFRSLEDGIDDYVRNYLIPKCYW